MWASWLFALSTACDAPATAEAAPGAALALLPFDPVLSDLVAAADFVPLLQSVHCEIVTVARPSGRPSKTVVPDGPVIVERKGEAVAGKAAVKVVKPALCCPALAPDEVKH